MFPDHSLNRFTRVIVMALLSGVLLVAAWFAFVIVLAQMGQEVIRDGAGAAPPPKPAFFEAKLFTAVAPWLFVAGFVGSLLGPGTRRRRPYR